MAAELGEWASLMDEFWPEIQGKTALTAGTIQHAKDVAVKLARAAGDRELGSVDVPKAQHIRAQAFSLMVNAYDQVRRSLSYLRWDEGDADSIAPTLYMGRPRGSKSDKSANGDAANATDNAATATPTNGASNATPTAAAPGLPGGSPLAS